MSRRSTGGGRSSRRSGNRGAGRRPAGRQSRERSGLDALFRDVLTATRGIAAADPLEVEVHASGLLSLSRGELHDPELDQAFADDLVRHLARAGTPDALALLHALAALIGPDARQEAVAAIGEVQAKGAEDPLGPRNSPSRASWMRGRRPTSSVTRRWWPSPSGMASGMGCGHPTSCG